MVMKDSASENNRLNIDNAISNPISSSVGGQISQSRSDYFEEMGSLALGSRLKRLSSSGSPDRRTVPEIAPPRESWIVPDAPAGSTFATRTVRWTSCVTNNVPIRPGTPSIRYFPSSSVTVEST